MFTRHFTRGFIIFTIMIAVALIGVNILSEFIARETNVEKESALEIQLAE